MKKILALLAATLYLLSPSANAQNTITGAWAQPPEKMWSAFAHRSTSNKNRPRRLSGVGTRNQH